MRKREHEEKVKEFVLFFPKFHNFSLLPDPNQGVKNDFVSSVEKLWEYYTPPFLTPIQDCFGVDFS